MNRRKFILLFFFCNILMVFLHIKKHANIVRQMYRKQRNEKIKEELMQKKSSTLRSLYTLKNPSSIKQFATEQLNMQKVCLHQIKTVTSNEK